MNDKLVTIICPSYNEENYIQNCIDSILNQDYPADLLQFLIVDGLSTDKTKSIVQENSLKHKNIQYIENKHKFVPQALNLGIENAKGDVIIRIDAHCVYPSNYVSLLVEKLYELNADNVGGVWVTLPSSNSTISLAIAIGSSHIFGVGASKHKIGASTIIETDTVPFGCYRREVFDKIGLFDTDLIRNQDDEFNARLIKNGGKIFLIPQLKINYFARKNLNKMNTMYFQYGLFKPLVNKKLKGAATIRQFFPLLFTVGLIFGLLLSFVSNIFLFIYLFSLFSYFILAVYFSVSEARKNNRLSLTFILPIVFFNIHLSYGIGYLIGIIKVLAKSSFQVKSSR